MAGHVTLNDLEYRTNGYPRQVLANQMAGKVGQGESKYADLESWSAWIQQDWRGGVGKVRPQEDGDGFLWSTADTRVPRQVILPPLVHFSEEFEFTGVKSDTLCWPFQTESDPGTIGSITVGDSGVERLAMRFTSNNPTSPAAYGFYIRVAKDVEIRISVYSNSSGEPGASQQTATLTIKEDTREFRWVLAHLSDISSPSTEFWQTIEVETAGADIEVLTATSGYSDAVQTYDGSSWSETAGTFACFVGERIASTYSYVLRLAGDTYRVRGAKFSKWDGAKWDTVASDVAAIKHPVVFGPNIYYIEGGGTPEFRSFDGSSVSAVSGEPGTGDYSIIHNDGKYLWVAEGNQAWYTADVSTWTGPFTFGGSDSTINAIASLEDRTYFATSKWLYYLAPGDFVQPVLRWGSEDENNGKGMIAHQGSLYIPANGRLFRYATDGTIQDIWAEKEDDIPAGRMGTIAELHSMNSWLVVSVAGQEPSSSNRVGRTIMALQGQSWHVLATTFNDNISGLNQRSLFYDRENSRLWFASNTMLYHIDIPDYALNPYTLDDYTYMPFGWVEWDFWEGPMLEEQKDFESITVIGEGIDSDNYVEVYYKEDDDTEWTLHGTATSNVHELRWDDLSTRATGTRIKIGILLVTTDVNSTPKVRAVRLKYHLMTRDWFAWNLNIEVSGTAIRQLMPDGTRNTRTAATLKSELDTLSKRVKPFIYRDIDGKQYEVKIKAGEFQYRRYEDLEGPDDQTFEGIYSLTLEQVTEDEFTP